MQTIIETTATVSESTERETSADSRAENALTAIDDIIDEANILLLGAVTQSTRDSRNSASPVGLDDLIRKLNENSAALTSDLAACFGDSDRLELVDNLTDTISETAGILISIAELIAPLSNKVSDRIAMLADRMHHVADGLSPLD